MATLPHVAPHPLATATDSKPARRRADHHNHRPSYACPRCLSTQVVAEPDSDPWEWLINRLGFRNMHCRQCSHKFVWI
jgi:hypothetical protein